VGIITGFSEEVRYDDDASESRRFAAARDREPIARWAGLAALIVIALLILAIATAGP